MSFIINLSIVLAGFIFMECAAWFSHKYIMHGFMWNWHKSHHTPRKGLFEKNDLFGVFFAMLAIGLIVIGSLNGLDWRFYSGIGVTLYGIAYFLVHDVFVHQRIPILKTSQTVYFQAMRFAHKIHHKVNTKHGAEAFGFLFVSKKYLDKYRQKKSNA